ncbi:hypothetical protein HOLleu_08741 [Holothuria leucospilota]|uniref:Uncharacterized protein n=1 Tax=Holothuria leucospilota TaxID=206669 RepID=A0A9Q1HH72_HOLLE|nr:hypothetical protein HOLleu_08741 [Holothuria leucospilota]
MAIWVTKGQKQNIPSIPKIVIWGHQRSKAKFPKNSQEHHLGLPEVKKQNFPRIPKVVIRVTKGQKQNVPSIPKIVIWSHQRSKSKISQEFSRSKIHWS